MATLYNQYRPKTFGDVVGQEFTTRALSNQTENGTVSHAYLFHGPRGTGKTTTARILANAVCCGEGSEPCLDCDICWDFANDEYVDLIELDAASRGGVDYARAITEFVQHLPVMGQYKIIIIDEAHMLSKSAANALLKTIEEPPEGVIFCLCTTEVHNIIPTIRSRCQEYKLRLLNTHDLLGLLRSILTKEEKHLEDEVLNLLIRKAEGSPRDAISQMETALSLDIQDYTEISRILYGMDPLGIDTLLSAINTGDSRKWADYVKNYGVNLDIVAEAIQDFHSQLLGLKNTLFDYEELAFILRQLNNAYAQAKKEDTLAIVSSIILLAVKHITDNVEVLEPDF
ncbi:MAG: DNA polymerase III subunit gamma/tau [Gammaproteobacteria bacterium]|nr:DNA polymerase III subunit gamma/tau [Gammaproteobacteria bacterium]